VPGKLNACIALALLIQVGAPQLLGQSSAKVPSNAPPDPAASAQTQTVNSGKTVGFQERYPRYQVLDGDTMDLVFEFSPEFNQTVTVQPDGYISLRGIGDVHIASQTLPELVTTLQTAYGKILNKPAISVLLKDFKRPYFTAQGQVQRAGQFPLHGETTLAEGIAMAGGFTDAAKHSHVVLFRRVSSEWTEAKVIDVKKMLKAGNLSEDYVLRPGDMIFVPKNTLSKISRFIPTSNLSTYISPTAF
jgi:polysaccharide export outer membrane protein